MDEERAAMEEGGERRRLAVGTTEEYNGGYYNVQRDKGQSTKERCTMYEVSKYQKSRRALSVCFCYEEFQKSVILTEIPPKRIRNSSMMSVMVTYR